MTSALTEKWSDGIERVGKVGQSAAERKIRRYLRAVRRDELSRLRRENKLFRGYLAEANAKAAKVERPKVKVAKSGL